MPLPLLNGHLQVGQIYISPRLGLRLRLRLRRCLGPWSFVCRLWLRLRRGLRVRMAVLRTTEVAISHGISVGVHIQVGVDEGSGRPGTVDWRRNRGVGTLKGLAAGK